MANELASELSKIRKAIRNFDRLEGAERDRLLDDALVVGSELTKKECERLAGWACVRLANEAYRAALAGVPLAKIHQVVQLRFRRGMRKARKAGAK